ncbi:hypothetical protein TRIUR3_32405 [Triticum urartu]|uniref:Uncharacterized protein n=1 Tax=Triticum urartu TaxID=4572 RepID=M7XM15_TRIUA|nr:hypothetical protein TRIUR3_32405 [Triticum urartu]
MKSEKKAQPSESPKDKRAKLAVVQQHPELLMAAREGDSARLNVLLGNGGAGAGTTPLAAHAGPSGVILNIIVEEAGAADKAAGTNVTVDMEPDNILHIVASSGDSPAFLESARIIHGKAPHLLDARNQKGDTPFHCAARAGMVKMVTQLISLAEVEGGGDRVKLALRKQNVRRERALHEALRFADKGTVWAMVNKLMAADAELARWPPANGTSPLYQAVSLGHDDIAERLHELDQGLSYCGPNGQNVLHVAVLRSTSEL